MGLSMFEVQIFKYNPCIGSMATASKNSADNLPFKYNPCIGSIATVPVIVSTVLPFKYNPCIGSIN